MKLKNALRELALPIDGEEANGTTPARKIADCRKYGQVKLERSLRRKKNSIKQKSWKQFESSAGPKRRKSPEMPKGTIGPHEDLVRLGKAILRSRRKVVVKETLPLKQPKRKSLFEKKDFKELAQDLRALFCS